MTAAGSLRRFVFKELKDGDLRKFQAASNDTQSGGGARDQRFSPYREFDGVFSRMFKGRSQKSRRMRDGSSKLSTIYDADVSVHIDDTGIDPATTKLKVVVELGEQFAVMNMKYWPPTNGRAFEGRLAQVNKLQLDPPTGEGRVFLLLIEDSTLPTVRLAFLTEHTVLNTQLWHPEVVKFFKEILSTPEADDAVMGYRDFDHNQSYVK